MRRRHTAYNEASKKGLRTTSTVVGNAHTAPLNRVDSDTIDTLAKLRMGLASVQIQFFVSRRFPLPLPFLPLLLGPWLFRPLPLFVSLNQQSLLMWPTRPHVRQLVFCPSTPSVGFPLPFFVRASFYMSSGPLLLLGEIVTACLVLRIVLH